MRHSLWIVAAVVVLSAGLSARAQAINTVSNNTFFEPEIDVVNSGALLDVQATVSADRKYVTLTMRPQMSTLLSLQTFTFQQGNGNVNGQVQLPVIGGVVGGINPVAGNAVAIPAVVNAPVRLGPGQGPALIARRGITPIVRN